MKLRIAKDLIERIIDLTKQRCFKGEKMLKRHVPSHPAFAVIGKTRTLIWEDGLEDLLQFMTPDLVLVSQASVGLGRLPTTTIERHLLGQNQNFISCLPGWSQVLINIIAN